MRRVLGVGQQHLVVLGRAGGERVDESVALGMRVLGGKPATASGPSERPLSHLERMLGKMTGVLTAAGSSQQKGGGMKGGKGGSESLIWLANSCGCSYKALVAFVREVTISDIEAFKAFEAFDKQLKDEDGFANLDTRVKDIFSSCQS